MNGSSLWARGLREDGSFPFGMEFALPRRMGTHSLLGFVGALLLSGCCQKYTVVRNEPVRYRLALDRPDARACFEECSAVRMEGRSRYAACLAACPRAKVEPGSVCGSSDVPPAAECVVLERKVRREAADPWPVILTLGAFATGAVAGGYAASTFGSGQRRSQ